MAHADIAYASHLLNLAKVQTDNTIKKALVQLCVIIYARPFGKIRGKHHSKPKMFYPLKWENVSSSDNSDHDTLMAERDQYVAHGDITAYNPRLVYFVPWDGFAIEQRPSHYYDHIDQRIETMLVLCDIVRKHLADRMTVMESSFREKMSLEKQK
jgi:hypothetical protein